MLSRRPKLPPGTQAPTDPANGEDSRPDDRTFDLAALAPVIVDEVIAVTRGEAVAHVDRASPSEGRAP